MKLSTLIILLVFLLSLSSCDPAHSITFINNGNSTLEVTMVIDTNENPSPNLFYPKKISDSIVMSIQPTESHTINLGMGTWTDMEIALMAKAIKQLKLENSEFCFTYKSQEKIESLFRNNVEKQLGWKTQIIITSD